MFGFVNVMYKNSCRGIGTRCIYSYLGDLVVIILELTTYSSSHLLLKSTKRFKIEVQKISKLQYYQSRSFIAGHNIILQV